MKLQQLKEVGIGLGLVILQIVFFRHLQIYTMQANIVLIFLLWYMARRNRTAAILLAALLGFIQDALLDQWGLNMFSNTLAVFIMYTWVPEDSEGQFKIPQVLTLVFITALIHNLFFIGLSSVVQRYTTELLFWRYWLGNAVYTALVAGIIQVFRMK